jgi:hypothetical protein
MTLCLGCSNKIFYGNKKKRCTYSSFGFKR